MVIPRIWLLLLPFLTAGALTVIADPPAVAPRDATAATNGPPVRARVVIAASQAFVGSADVRACTAMMPGTATPNGDITAP